MTGRRVVISGPPGSGKSTWAKAHAGRGDLVWDLDEIAGLMAYEGRLPDELKGNLPWAVMKATLKMRDALVAWLALTETQCGVYIIVSDVWDAQHVARSIRAEVVTMGSTSGARNSAVSAQGVA